MSADRSYMNDNKCCCCSRWLKSNDKSIRSVSKPELLNKLNKIRPPRNNRMFIAHDFICSRCVTRANLSSKNQINNDQDVNSNSNYDNSSIDGVFDDNSNMMIQDDDSNKYNDNSTIKNILLNNHNENSKNKSSSTSEKNNKTNKISIDISRAVSSHKKCLICKPHNINQKLRRIPIEAIIDVYLERDLLIPEGSRCCSCHLNDNDLLTEESINQIEEYADKSNFNSEHLKNILESFKLLAKKNDLFAKFESVKSITNDICIKNTGFTKPQFLEIADCIVSIVTYGINTFGSSHEYFLKHLIIFQSYKLTLKCPKCRVETNRNLKSLTFTLINGEVKLDLENNEFCSVCDIKLNKSYEFSIENPPWLLIDTEPDSTLRYNSLPSILNVSNRSYQFICCTIHHGIHFRAIFHLNNKDFLVDDLYPDTLKESTPRDRINVSIYFLV